MVELELRSVTKAFEHQEILKDFSLGVNKDELCCILGPSGCGKTTVLKLIAGFLSPESGTIWLQGRDITRLTPQKRDIGMVFQNYALFPHLSVFENIAYGLRRRRVGKSAIQKRVAKILDLVQLEAFQSAKIHELSGGQQQRVALARSLVIEPDLLLLDEPLSNLDAQLRIQMRQEIARLQRELNVTMIYVTHDQEEALSIADQVVVMNRGAIEQIAAPKEIYEKPSSLFVADFIGRVNVLAGTVENGRLQVLDTWLTLRHSSLKNGKVNCAVRPERISLKEAGNGMHRGQVLEVTYLGPWVRYLVRASGNEQDLLIDVPCNNTQVKPGQSIDFDIKIDDILFFPRHSGTSLKY